MDIGLGESCKLIRPHLTSRSSFPKARNFSPTQYEDSYDSCCFLVHITTGLLSLDQSSRRFEHVKNSTGKPSGEMLGSVLRDF